ncbi:MAG: hypothetical protein LBK52_07835, partial [Deltaproteobacteria bacterium]|nr:hypothetical protein [Deltaproteobacteria bacterium]
MLSEGRLLQAARLFLLTAGILIMSGCLFVSKERILTGIQGVPDLTGRYAGADPDMKYRVFLAEPGAGFYQVLPCRETDGEDEDEGDVPLLMAAESLGGSRYVLEMTGFEGGTEEKLIMLASIDLPRAAVYAAPARGAPAGLKELAAGYGVVLA